MGLTKRQRSFVVIYCEDPKLGQTEAARKAGYSVNRAKQAGYDLMRHPDVKLEIERQLANKLGHIETQAKSKEVSRESLCQQCDEVIEQCTGAGPGAWQMQNRLKAIELKAKLYGLLSEEVELGLDDKLVELLESGRRRSGLTPIQTLPVVKGELIAGSN